MLRNVKEDFNDLLEETKKLKELKLLEETEITGVGTVRLSINYLLQFFNKSWSIVIISRCIFTLL